jgi:hypothetical protein
LTGGGGTAAQSYGLAAQQILEKKKRQGRGGGAHTHPHTRYRQLMGENRKRIEGRWHPTRYKKK